MRIRSARNLVFSRESGRILASHVLTRSSFSCSPDIFVFLSMVDNWTDCDELPNLLPATPKEELPQTVRDLLGVNAIVEEHSVLAATEEEFAADWKWGNLAAAFHFGLQDREFMPLDQAEAAQVKKLATTPQPALYVAHHGSAIELPDHLERDDLIRLMARRRTIRSATPRPILLNELSACLFAGMGITGFTENRAGRLPLAMTPSGGARHPYEAFVYARNVDGLEQGFYHYSALDHSLGRIETQETPPPSLLLGGQDWADEMPCVLFLCAWLERSMWKYDDAGAYRVVMIEAGHIGQNVMLAATRYGLTACPTAALNHSAITACLRMDDRIVHAPIYALTLGEPREVDGASSGAGDDCRGRGDGRSDRNPVLPP